MRDAQVNKQPANHPWRGRNYALSIGICQKNREKTHCIRGHPLSGDNLNRTKTGRECIACRRLRQRNYSLARKLTS